MEQRGKLFVSQVVSKFNLEVVANSNYVDREISSTGISRAGFELSGEILFKEIWSILYFGSKETYYFNKFSNSIISKKLTKVFELNPPLIIYGRNFKHSEILLKVAKNFKIPIVKVDYSFYELNFTINSYISQKLSWQNQFHGTLLSIFGVGVILQGESGVGKSELAIELVKKGHIFVADDAVVATRIGGYILGRAAELTKDFIEVRGLGIMNFSRSFGIERIIDSTRIEVIIELTKTKNDDHKKFERFGFEIRKKQLMGVDLVYYNIPVTEGRSIADVIETAITDYKLKTSANYNSALEFLDLQKRNDCTLNDSNNTNSQQNKTQQKD